MKFSILAAAAALSVSMAGSAFAAPVTFDFTASGFEDFSFPTATALTGSITGEFTVDDSLGTMAGLVETSEISGVSFTLSGFTIDPFDDLYNGAAASMTSQPAGAVVELDGSGLSANSFSLVVKGNPNTTLQINLQFSAVDLFDAVNFNDATTSTFSITQRTPPNVVPLPATLPFLIAGLGGLAVMRRRKTR